MISSDEGRDRAGDNVPVLEQDRSNQHDGDREWGAAVLMDFEEDASRYTFREGASRWRGCMCL